MIRFPCPHCQKTLSVKDELAGRSGKCPHCKQPAQVPGEVAVGKVTMAAPLIEAQETLSPGAEGASVGETKHGAPVGTSPEHYDFLAPPQEPDELGRLGTYRILKVLGAGGMGVVFQAEDPGLKRKIALKAMLPALAASDSARKRFLREAQTAAAIEHDHIVTIHQVGEDRGVPFIAMQFLKGEALDDRLKREPRPSLADAVRIGKETALGLAAAHQHGLIHRDIKPANLWLETRESGNKKADGEKGRKGESDSPLLSNPWRVKILDFGLARSAGDNANLTQSGAIIGTPAYMAPEQANGKPVDARCDLFSLGCVLYRLCTGKLPFKGTDTLSMLMAIASENPPAPSDLDARIPQPLSDFIMQLLAKPPEQRPASADDVAQTLARLEKSKAIAQADRAGPAPLAKAKAIDTESDDGTEPRTTTGKRPKAVKQESRQTAGMPGWVLGAALGGGALVIVVVAVVGYFVWKSVAGGKPDSSQSVARTSSQEGSSSSSNANRQSSTSASSSTSSSAGGGASSAPASSSSSSEDAPADDRAVAIWAINLGADVMLNYGQGARDTFKNANALPSEPFFVYDLSFRQNCQVRDDDLKQIAGLTQLERLTFYSQPISDAGVAHLKNLPKLTNLWLIDSKISDDSLALIARRFPELDSMLLDRAKITNKGLAELAKLPKLGSLGLSKAQIRDDDLAGLKGAPKLAQLTLDDIPLTDAALVHIKELDTLLGLRLQRTKITDVGLKHLEDLPRLTVLSLANTQVTSKGLASLAKIGTLADLGLRGTQIEDKGLEALKGLEKLTLLDLAYTNIGDDGLARIQGMKRVTNLNLSQTQITNACLEHLKTLPELRMVFVARTKLTPDDLKKFMAELPKAKFMP